MSSKRGRLRDGEPYRPTPLPAIVPADQRAERKFRPLGL